ncbi:hypothetical protein B0H14DRAFT_3454337 [Mycena olivaceomarginata]|nr:hypothetical protein B0H14DRAFT_3454337 [Mycena olivaceomarginata]
MYHACLARVFESLKAYMMTPDIVCCPDGHFRCVIYGIGPYIADYPEQTKIDLLITSFDPGILWDDYGIHNNIIPFTYDFPNQGTFKDHLVSWVNECLVLKHSEKHAFKIIQDIDRRPLAVPEFPGLRRFPDGHNFSQWTGDNSKALMKIYIAAISGYVPSGMVKCLSTFMDFCYLVRRNAISTLDLTCIKSTLDRFHHFQTIFIKTGVCDDMSLPCQHALVHYVPSIKLFGSSNGLCSSVTESKHIKAVKEPWRCSSCYKVLPQILATISHLKKIAAA